MFSYSVSKVNGSDQQQFPLIILLIILAISIATISSSATTVNISVSRPQGKLGIFMRSYFENANASLSSSPSVNTGTTIPASSGSYLIPKGGSAYLWTPQFSLATPVSSGKMTLDLWAGPTPELDGTNSSGFTAISGTIKLTTIKTNDLIYVFVAIPGAQTASISGGGLTWASRGLSSRSEGRVYAFTAVSPGILSAVSITATLSSSQSFVITAFGVSGVNIASPFDSNLSSPALSNGRDQTPTVSFSTTNANDFIIAGAFINNVPAVSLGIGFSVIAITAGNGMTEASEYATGGNSGSQTASFSISGRQGWAMIGDALVPAAVPVTISAFTTNSAGIISSTLFSGISTNPIPSTSGQVASVFNVALGSIPSSGYIEVVLTAPATSNIEILWGNGQPTNFQVAFTYG